MSHAVPSTGRPPRGATSTTWLCTVGVLAGSTVLLVAYLALLVAAEWLVVVGWNTVTTGPSETIDVVRILLDAAPAVLVGWCTGLAASAVLARGEALGARTTGLAAGALGSAAGAAVLTLTGLL